MAYFTYVLQDKNGKLYKGFTNDLKRRFYEHKKGGVTTTSKMKDIKLVYSEKFDNLTQARKREVYFKTAAGRRFLKKILNKGS